MTALEQILAGAIRATGPIALAEYMAAAAAHPRSGYYTAQEPFGAAGDFVTAPEISQMFGELIGLWAAGVWQALGAPPRVILAEAGPGRGTLMRDAHRAARVLPGFLNAAETWFVEPSPRLRAIQAEAHPQARFAPDLDGLPDGPLIFLANEVLDALPVHQYVARHGRWHEQMVGVDDHGALCLALSPPLWPAEVEDGTVHEDSPAAEAFVAALASRLAAQGGAALLIDYGDVKPRGPTVQAVQAHRSVPLLTSPGEADISAHVAFGPLAQVAAKAGARTFGPVTQGAFLEALGIGLRARRLAQAAPARAAEIAQALARLTGADQMGTLFKVLGLAGPGLDALPGLGPTDSAQAEAPQT